MPLWKPSVTYSLNLLLVWEVGFREDVLFIDLGRGLSVLALETVYPNQSHTLTEHRECPPNSPLLIGNQTEYPSPGLQRLKIIIEPSFSPGQKTLEGGRTLGLSKTTQKEQRDLEVPGPGINSTTNLLCDFEKVT